MPRLHGEFHLKLLFAPPMKPEVATGQGCVVKVR